MIAKKLLSTIAFAFVLLFTGCAEDDFNEVDGLCPLVIATVPEDGDIDVPLNQVITATFNEKMNPSTITGESFTVSANGGLINGTITYSDSTAVFTPSSLLDENAEYTGTITTLAKDERGNALQEDYVWSFVTVLPLPEFSVEVSSNPVLGGFSSGSGTFDQGTAVTVTAVPNEGYTFTNWTENEVVVSSSPSYQFVLIGDRTLVANYSLIPPTQFAVNLSSSPIEGGSTNGSGSFDEGTNVTVTATVNPGYNFVNWTLAGVQVSTNATYTFALNLNTALVANFAIKTYTLQVNAENGSVLTVPQQDTYNHGDSVELTATPATGYEFTSWTGDATGTDNPLTVVMNGNKVITANFTIKTYTLTVNAVNGTVLKVPQQATYNHGATVVLTPTATTGYEFTSWTVDATGNSNPLTVTMNSDKVITANFSPLAAAFTLNVTAINGTVSKNPNNPTYNDGDNLVLTATPNSGYEFTSWSGDATGTNNPLTVLMNANKNITANFILSGVATGPGIIDLGTAGDFVILSKSGIDRVGVTSITGNIGVSPIDQTAITGFSQIMDVTNTFSTSSYVNGKIYAADYTAPTPAYLTTAVSDMETAFTKANGLSTNVIVALGAGDISGMTLAPGLYKWDTGLLITNEGVTLSGGPDDTWVFQISDDFTINNDAIITLAGGAQAKNIFWVTSTQALLGSDVQFKGNILAQTLISVNTGTSVTGKLLSQTAVTLKTATVVDQN